MNQEDKQTYANKVSDGKDKVKVKSMQQQEPCYILKCVDGPLEGQQISIGEFSGLISIGSDKENDIVLDDEALEPKHIALQKADSTIYYTAKDLTGKSGFFMKLSNYSSSYLADKKVNEFEFFGAVFFIEFDEEKKNYFLRFEKNDSVTFSIDLTEGRICLGDDFYEMEIGTAEATITVNSDATFVHKILISKSGKFIYVNKISHCFTENGLFYRVNDKEKVLIRGGDYMKLGSNKFRVMTHNWDCAVERFENAFEVDRFAMMDDMRIFDDKIMSFYGLFGGEGTKYCSNFLFENYHKALRDMTINELTNSDHFLKDFSKIVQNSLIYIDFLFSKKEKNMAAKFGATMVFVVVIDNIVFCCNLGDNKCLLHEKLNNKTISMAKAHNAFREKERERVERKNGYIENNMILGSVKASRAVGYWNFKNPNEFPAYKLLKISDYLISNRAEFRYAFTKKESEYFIVLCSEEVNKLMSDDELIELIVENEDKYRIDGTIQVDSMILDLKTVLYNRAYGKDAPDGEVLIENISLAIIYLN